MSTKEVNEILSKIRKYEISHPVLTELWTTFILQRYKKLNQGIEECENMLLHIDEIKDMHPFVIFIIFFFFKKSVGSSRDIGMINT